MDGLPEALTLPYAERDALTHHAGSGDGKSFMYKDLASQWSAHALDAQPGETILDLAAARAARLDFIAARMARATSAVEPVRDRFFRHDAEPQASPGVTNVKFYMRGTAGRWGAVAKPF